MDNPMLVIFAIAGILLIAGALCVGLALLLIKAAESNHPMRNIALVFALIIMIRVALEFASGNITVNWEVFRNG